MARKKYSAEAVKRMPVGTVVELRAPGAEKGVEWMIIRSYNKKVLSLIGLHEVTRKIDGISVEYWVEPKTEKKKDDKGGLRRKRRALGGRN